MNRKKIRDHRRVARRFRFSVMDGTVSLGSTTWPMTKDKDGKRRYNRFVHSAAIVNKTRRNIRRRVLVTKEVPVA